MQCKNLWELCIKCCFNDYNTICANIEKKKYIFLNELPIGPLLKAWQIIIKTCFKIKHYFNQQTLYTFINQSCNNKDWTLQFLKSACSPISKEHLFEQSQVLMYYNVLFSDM